MHRQYALSVRKDTSAIQSHQGAKVKLDYQDNSRVDSCDETCLLTQQIPYMSLFASRFRCHLYLGTLSQITFRFYLDLDITFDFWDCYIFCDLRLSPQHSGSVLFLGYHEVGWQFFLLLPLRSISSMSWLEFLVLHFLSFYLYVQ